MDVIQRLNEVKKAEKLTYGKLAKLTGIDADRWRDVFNRRVELRFKETELICSAFPEYKRWIMLDEEAPESGQISPMTKTAHENLETPRKAGK